jgi:hypothetical protein
MFGRKKAKAIADKLQAQSKVAKPAKKTKSLALSPSAKIKKRSESMRERRKHEPAV